MDDNRSVEEAYRMLLEKMILDAGMKLPGVYDGLPRKEQEKHRKRVDKLRYGI